jgi:hypothetical protein
MKKGLNFRSRVPDVILLKRAGRSLLGVLDTIRAEKV